jgi:two-component system chemotaxis sensor kinase CheA
MERDPVIEALVEGFAAEAREICKRLTGQVLALEHGGELDELARRNHYEELARGIHTLKGNSDTFGFPQLGELAHRMEDVVQAFRPSLAALPSAATDVLLRAVDVFVARIAARHTPDAELPPIRDLLDALGDAAASGRALAPVEPPPAVSRTITPVTAPAVTDELLAASAIDEWRVGPQRVDALVREIERLRELRLRLDEQHREVDVALHGLRRGQPVDPIGLRDSLQTLSRGLQADSTEAADIVESLEQEMKLIATLPLRWILDPLQRAVRDLARGIGKEARLSCLGADISLDRRLLEALKGPLVHLVRNAVDHGIETPERRIAAGKHREGAITIRVERTGNLVFIEIEDDGGGIDADEIRAAAVARGVMAHDEAEALGEHDLHRLLFRSGFSTRREITELSGRGIGLDVVRDAVQGLDGHIDVQTTRGSGARFQITVPATLGSTPLLVVHVDEHVLGLPMVAVETIRSAGPEDMHPGRIASRFEHGGYLLPVVDLAAVLGLRSPVPIAVGQAIVILHARGSRIALAVDELLGDRDLVVRPLPSELQDMPAYQGAATLGRGDLVLVLQPEFLVAEGVVTTAARTRYRKVLVVDDSLTARALHRTMLESGGYQVHTVGSARQAIDHLRFTSYDVVIADIVMAEIDGIELTTMLRARRETRTTPIILVSSHDTDTDRERGRAAGADVFLSKKDCMSGRLLAEVAALIGRREQT